eukprot:TRINITY_DN11960_c0_g1_i1.p1 TRINITY_DN11960_c0_g1~~TRINITY_DN11960_c0_g1_i1.p1  ORF type:complete len:537 (-),score=147.35 TRINITY_DN11960_c0_g1_i1:218-1828(-)
MAATPNVEALIRENDELKKELEFLKARVSRAEGKPGRDGTLQEPEANKALSIIIIGASGDLAKKKTYPSVYSLFIHGLLPPQTNVIGYARSKMARDEYLKQISANFKGGSEEQRKEFLSRCFYTSGQYDEDGSYKALVADLEKLEKESVQNCTGANRIFYFAIPPSIFVQVSTEISHVAASRSGWNRIVVEKPFGMDLESSRVLGKQLSALFDESQLYRIDHYLGKEMVQALLSLRFANTVFEALWSSVYISNVLITFKEDIGTQGRGGYFDQFGIIRDVMQNHLTQILALVAMEPPVSLSAEDIRDEKVKLLRCIEPVTMDDITIGQYLGKGKEPGYLDDPTVPKGSKTPTYAMAALHVNNARWQGTPFILKCGKALNERKAEIRIQFRCPPFNIYQDFCAPNELVIRVQPDEAIYLKMVTKKPGLTNELELSELDLTYKSRFEFKSLPDAYERLILDVVRGDHNLFVRADELEEAWKIFTPILHQLEKEKTEPEMYEFGSRSTPKSDELLKRYGWIRIEGYYWKKPTNEPQGKL